MAFRLTPPVFRREVQRRLLDVRAVQALLGEAHRQSVWWKVKTGELPEPVLRQERGYALWDADEIASWNGKK